jgi:hypothetical protein
MKADIFSLLQENVLPDPGQSALPLLSLWRVAIYYFVFFTLHPDKFASHYDEDEQGHFLCPGEGCPACAAGLRATEHVYLPVWDV